MLSWSNVFFFTDKRDIPEYYIQPSSDIHQSKDIILWTSRDISVNFSLVPSWNIFLFCYKKQTSYGIVCNLWFKIYVKQHEKTFINYLNGQIFILAVFRALCVIRYNLNLISELIWFIYLESSLCLGISGCHCDVNRYF